ncbi:MAG: hypothetical protein ACFFCE_00275 [Promethearchaeota archaeon]
MRNFLEKVKRKYKSFKKNESGGEIINQVLVLAITVIIIGLLLVFAIAQFTKAKEGFIDLFTSDGNSKENEAISISQNKIQETISIQNKCNAATIAILDKTPLLSKVVLAQVKYKIPLNIIELKC